MVPGIYLFGHLQDGTPVDQICLQSAGMTVSVLTWGAVIRDLRISLGSVTDRRVVLGLNSLQDYLLHSPHFGAIAGRYANRIAGGRFHLDGSTYKLTRNQNDSHHLHGGRQGYGKRVWTVTDISPSHVTLRLIDVGDSEGYPGTVTASCTYRIETTGNQALLCVDLSAETTAPTPVNLVQHSYFNLDESADISSHKLQVEAQSYLPTDDDLIPTGEVRPVEGTPFDFRRRRLINPGADPNACSYDNNFVIARRRKDNPVRVATLTGNRGLAMDVLSTEPGLQVYDGSRVSIPVKGLAEHIYGKRAGICLEPQAWPDSPNQADFPPAILRPGEIYRQATIFRFSEAESP